MSTEVLLTALNVFQACFIAWITYQQARVKTELERVNGHVDQELLALRGELRQLLAPVANEP